MTGQRFTINSRKYDLSLRRSWNAALVERAEEYILLEGVFEDGISHPELGEIAKGTRSVESFFPGRWYNFFAFFEPSGEFRNHYINISMPPEIMADTIDYIDLDIDVIVWPDGRMAVLDVDEFEENSRIFNYPPEIVERTLRLKEDIAEDPQRFVTPFISMV